MLPIWFNTSSYHEALCDTAPNCLIASELKGVSHYPALNVSFLSILWAVEHWVVWNFAPGHCCLSCSLNPTMLYSFIADALFVFTAVQIWKSFCQIERKLFLLLSRSLPSVGLKECYHQIKLQSLSPSRFVNTSTNWYIRWTLWSQVHFTVITSMYMWYKMLWNIFIKQATCMASFIISYFTWTWSLWIWNQFTDY